MALGWAHELATLWTCWKTERWLIKVTPKIFTKEVRSTSASGGGVVQWHKNWSNSAWQLFVGLGLSSDKVAAGVVEREHFVTASFSGKSSERRFSVSRTEQTWSALRSLCDRFWLDDANDVATRTWDENPTQQVWTASWLMNDGC